MFLSLLKQPQRLSVLQYASTGEALADLCVEKRGAFSLTGFSKRLRLTSEEAHSEGISFRWEKKKFSLSAPASVQIKLKENKSLWPGSPDSDVRVSFEWTQLPPGLELMFPNGQKLLFDQSEPTKFHLSSNFKTLGMVSSITGLHAIAFAFVVFSVQFSQAHKYELNKQKQPSIDLSQLDVRLQEFRAPVATRPARSLSATPARPKALSALSQLNRKTKRRTRAPSNQILSAKTRSSEVFEQTSQSSAQNENSWEIGYDSLNLGHETQSSGTPLNVPEGVIAKAFKHVIPRLKECYDDALIKDSTLTGRLNLWVDISEAGVVDQVKIDSEKSVKQSSIARLESCFSKAYSRLRLAVKPNQAFSVKHSLLLKSDKLASN